MAGKAEKGSFLLFRLSSSLPPSYFGVLSVKIISNASHRTGGLRPSAKGVLPPSPSCSPLRQVFPFLLLYSGAGPKVGLGSSIHRK